MTTLPLPLDTVEAEPLLQVIPLTPTIDQLPEPVGVSPLAGPVTVAVKMNEAPIGTGAMVLVVTTGDAGYLETIGEIFEFADTVK